MARLRTLARLGPYLRRHALELAGGVACIVLGNALAVGAWAQVMATIDAFGEPGASSGSIVAAAAAAFGIFAAGAAFRFLMRYLMSGASRRIECEFRNDLFDHLTRLSPSYYDSHLAGDIMARATNDLDAVRTVLGPGIMYPINAAIIAPAVLVMMASISSPLTLVSLGPLLVMPLLVRTFMRAVHRRFKAVQETYGLMSARVRENLAGIRVVKTFAREDEETASFGRVNAAYRRRALRLAGVQSIFFPLMTAIVVLGQLVMIWVGVRLMYPPDGSAPGLTYGGFFAFVGLYGELTWPMMALGWVIPIIERGAVSMARLVEILDARPETPPPAPGAGAGGLSGRIEVRGLTFSYNGGTPVLSDVSFAVGPGEILAVVGPVGAGKSTLLRLLPRLYPAPRGHIRIDGRDLDDIPVEELRRSIGMVPQVPFLFSATIRENILFGRPGVDGDGDAVARAAARARLAEAVDRFPEGYETLLGERGVNLSGGQKQRTALARALIRDPPIVLLDDCFASVDAETEEQILAELRGELAGRTTIMVTHRLSTAALATRTIVFDRGRIVERGTHAELLAAGGLYAELARRQRLLDEIEVRNGPGGPVP
jgi:ATP-binding cassette subfamily B protein